jgi:hypothetical protein
MRKVAIAATLLSVALVGSASAQKAIATDPFTGAVTGANAAAAQGAAAAGPLGALVAAPLGLAAGCGHGHAGCRGSGRGSRHGHAHRRGGACRLQLLPGGLHALLPAEYPESGDHRRGVLRSGDDACGVQPASRDHPRGVCPSAARTFPHGRCLVEADPHAAGGLSHGPGVPAGWLPHGSSGRPLPPGWLPLRSGPWPHRVDVPRAHLLTTLMPRGGHRWPPHSLWLFPR